MQGTAPTPRPKKNRKKPCTISSITAAGAQRRLAEKNERNKRIWELRQTGLTLRAIGEQFMVGHERVRQICAKIDRIRAHHARNGGLYWGA